MFDNEKILLFDSFEKLSREAAKLFLRSAVHAVRGKGFFTCAFSGGTSPQTFFRMLAEEPFISGFPWGQSHFFQVDERFVPYESEFNNYRAAHEAFLSKVPVPKENLHRMRTDTGTPEQSAAVYKRELHTFFREHDCMNPKGIPMFDLIQLGMGEDGHTASLFPGSPSLLESEKIVVHTESPNTSLPAVERVTITYPLINSARNVFFIIKGSGKIEKLKKFVAAGNDEYAKSMPAARVNVEHTLWLCCP